jgi:glucose dehydrogenase
MTILRLAVRIAVLAVTFAPQSAFPVGDVDPSRLKAADSEPQNWVTVGRDQNQTYYSPLAKINAGNVSRLDWQCDAAHHYAGKQERFLLCP